VPFLHKYDTEESEPIWEKYFTEVYAPQPEESDVLYFNEISAVRFPKHTCEECVADVRYVSAVLADTEHSGHSNGYQILLILDVSDGSLVKTFALPTEIEFLTNDLYTFLNTGPSTTILSDYSIGFSAMPQDDLTFEAAFIDVQTSEMKKYDFGMGKVKVVSSVDSYMVFGGAVLSVEGGNYKMISTIGYANADGSWERVFMYTDSELSSDSSSFSGYMPTVLVENQFNSELLGLASPVSFVGEGTQSLALASDVPQLFFRVTLNPSSTCSDLNMNVIKFNIRGDSSIYLMGMNILASENDRFALWFEQTTSGASDLKLVSFDFPYKLSCSRDQLRVLGDNDVASPFSLSSSNDGAITLDFDFFIHEYGRNC
jgi:hypothetical protein